MDVDFFTFDSFTVPSASAGCRRVVCKVESADVGDDETEIRVISLHALIQEPAEREGEHFLFMIKRLDGPAGPADSSAEALGYITFVERSRPENEADQLSGACVEADEKIFRKFRSQAKRSPRALRLILETAFPPKQSAPWCAMGHFTSCALERKGKSVAAASLDDLRKGAVQFPG